ncbi:MAG TPA: prepilin-type N-terminal cleavage/methylation domain-containing protein [Acidocella sp.]|jgi:general secretion pathway protein J|nr:prepilin-type N-terminal cleavage/methylation domain-containing protein [Acidocella sp.]
MKQQDRREDGYTLLEMLVALVVFGLVMAGIAQSYRFGLTAWSAGEHNTTEPENIAALDAALTRIIEAAQPGSMIGTPNQLALTTTLPPGAGLPGLADAAILLQPDGTLILRYAPHAPGVPLTPPPRPRIEPLLHGVTGFSTAYLVPAQNAPAAWSSKWSGEKLPLLVRLHVRLADGRDWPDLIAAPADQGNPDSVGQNSN